MVTLFLYVSGCVFACYKDVRIQTCVVCKKNENLIQKKICKVKIYRNITKQI